MDPSDTLITQQTMHWIQSFIIEYTICPFAKRVVDQGGLTIEVIRENTPEPALEALVVAIRLMENTPQIETMLLVIPTFLQDFFCYLDFVDLAEALKFEQGYEGIYQLATFHPDYCFAGVAADDVSNYTNRSPYPMLHLLREDSIDKAIRFYGDTEQIPQNNIALMHKLGLDRVKKITRGQSK